MTTTTHLKLKSHQVSKITQHTFTLQTDSGTVHYHEWWNPQGIVIDSALKDSDGNEIIDIELYDAVQELIFGNV